VAAQGASLPVFFKKREACVRSSDSITTFRGRGRIFRDGVLAHDDARYVVHVTNNTDPAQIEGVLMSDAPFSLLRQPIELELEDGRRWACVLQSTSGDLVNRTGLSGPTQSE
jgi:hypothetical protein